MRLGAGRLTVALLAAISVVGVAAPGATAGSSAGDASLELVGQTPWTLLDGAVDLDLSIVGAPLDARVRVVVHSAVLSRTAFDLTLDGTDLGGTVHELELPVDALAPIASSERRLTLLLGADGEPGPDDPGPDDPGPGEPGPDDPGPPPLGVETVPLTESGVYPVEVALEVDDEEADAFVTHLVVVDGDGDGPVVGERLGLAWVWPLDVVPSLTAEGTLAPTAAAELDPGGRLGRQVEALAATSVPVTVAPGGFTVAQWLGIGGPTAEALAESLEAPNQVIGGGYVPLDLPSLLAAGLRDAVSDGLVAGTAVLEDAFDGRVDTRTRLALPVDEEAFARLTDAHVDRMLVDDEDLEPVASELTPARPFALSSDERSVQAATPDAGLGAILDGDDPPVLRAQHFLAALSLVATEAPALERGLVVVNPRRWAPEPELLSAALAGLDGHPLVEAMTLDGFFDSVPPATEGGTAVTRSLDPRPPANPPIDPDAYERAVERQAALRDFAGPLSPRVVPGDQALLVAPAAVWGPDSAVAMLQLTLVDTTIDEFMDDIRIPVGSSITLTARTGQIPLTILNETGQEVAVRVTLESDKLDFPDGATHDIVLPPRSSTEQFEVETLTPGRFPLTLTVTSPDGELVVSTARVDVRSTAVSGVGVFLTAGAGLVLAGWWANDLRKRRRTRAAD